MLYLVLSNIDAHDLKLLYKSQRIRYALPSSIENGELKETSQNLLFMNENRLRTGMSISGRIDSSLTGPESGPRTNHYTMLLKFLRHKCSFFLKSKAALR
jgi:hypothetical protein